MSREDSKSRDRRRGRGRRAGGTVRRKRTSPSPRPSRRGASRRSSRSEARCRREEEDESLLDLTPTSGWRRCPSGRLPKQPTSSCARTVTFVKHQSQLAEPSQETLPRLRLNRSPGRGLRQVLAGLPASCGRRPQRRRDRPGVPAPRRRAAAFFLADPRALVFRAERHAGCRRGGVFGLVFFGCCSRGSTSSGRLPTCSGGPGDGLRRRLPSCGLALRRRLPPALTPLAFGAAFLAVSSSDPTPLGGIRGGLGSRSTTTRHPAPRRLHGRLGLSPAHRNGECHPRRCPRRPPDSTGAALALLALAAALSWRRACSRCPCEGAPMTLALVQRPPPVRIRGKAPRRSSPSGARQPSPAPSRAEDRLVVWPESSFDNDPLTTTSSPAPSCSPSARPGASFVVGASVDAPGPSSATRACSSTLTGPSRPVCERCTSCPSASTSRPAGSWRADPRTR